ncbi:unnamed protein product, partial [Ectocarpus sp. 12 AP-2014]
DLPGDGATSLPCRPTPHEFHTRCVEREFRVHRRRDGPTVTMDCPFCRGMVIVDNVPGFEAVRVSPPPLQLRLRDGMPRPERLHEYLGRRALNRRPIYGVLSELAADVLGLSYPPFAPPENWSAVVEYFRSLDPCLARDDVAIPVLGRDAAFRRRLQSWADEVHREGSDSPAPALPLPAGQVTDSDATPPPSPAGQGGATFGECWNTLEDIEDDVADHLCFSASYPCCLHLFDITWTRPAVPSPVEAADDAQPGSVQARVHVTERGHTV